MKNVYLDVKYFSPISHDLWTVPWIMLGPENYIIHFFRCA